MNLWGFAQFGLPRQPAAVTVQGTTLRLPVPVLHRPLLHRPARRLPGRPRAAGGRSVISSGDRRAGRSADPPPAAAGDALEAHLTLLETGSAPLPRPPESGRLSRKPSSPAPRTSSCRHRKRRAAWRRCGKPFTDTLFQHLMVFLDLRSYRPLLDEGTSRARVRRRRQAAVRHARGPGRVRAATIRRLPPAK